MSRVAAIDCGTNSLRLLVTDLEGSSQQDLLRRNEIVRLGQGVDRTGEISAQALERTAVALLSYSEDMQRLGAERTRMVATSATRDARNRDEFVAMVRACIGVDPEVISGDEEAQLSFAGATRALVPHRPLLVCDIGGGSTELVRGRDVAEASLSVDVGCVRLAERHFTTGLPAAADQVTALTADAEAAVQRLLGAVRVEGADRLVCLAGTATTVTALVLGLETYDATRTHLAQISLADLERTTDWLVGASREEIAARAVVDPGRVDVIAAGAVVLRTVVRAVGLGGFTTSESDILDGIAWSIVGDR